MFGFDLEALSPESSEQLHPPGLVLLGWEPPGQTPTTPCGSSNSHSLGSWRGWLGRAWEKKMGLNHVFQKDTFGAIQIRDSHLGALLEVLPLHTEVTS